MRPLLGKALIGELLPALQLAYHAFKDFCGCGERRELACELRPRMLTPDQAPDFSSTPRLTPISSTSPSREMPSPYRMSNSACLKGGATLFFTTLTRVSEPTTSSPFLIEPMR